VDLPFQDVKNLNTLSLPIWLIILYLGSNTVLNFLNLYWFSKMIRTVRNRFKPSTEEQVNTAAKTGDVPDQDASGQSSGVMDDIKSTVKQRPKLSEQTYSSDLKTHA
jgi:hypothetical protein